MTGIRISITRDGRAQFIEIEDLTDAELLELSRQRPLEGWQWVAALVVWLRLVKQPREIT